MAKFLARNSDVSRLDRRSVENLVRRTSTTRVMLIPNIERQEGSTVYGGCFCHGTRRGRSELEGYRVHGGRPFRDDRGSRESSWRTRFDGCAL